MTTKSLKSKMDDLDKDSGYENQLQVRKHDHINKYNNCYVHTF